MEKISGADPSDHAVFGWPMIFFPVNSHWQRRLCQQSGGPGCLLALSNFKTLSEVHYVAMGTAVQSFVLSNIMQCYISMSF